MLQIGAFFTGPMVVFDTFLLLFYVKICYNEPSTVQSRAARKQELANEENDKDSFAV